MEEETTHSTSDRASLGSFQKDFTVIRNDAHKGEARRNELLARNWPKMETRCLSTIYDIDFKNDRSYAVSIQEEIPPVQVAYIVHCILRSIL